MVRLIAYVARRRNGNGSDYLSIVGGIFVKVNDSKKVRGRRKPKTNRSSASSSCCRTRAAAGVALGFRIESDPAVAATLAARPVHPRRLTTCCNGCGCASDRSRFVGGCRDVGDDIGSHIITARRHAVEPTIRTMRAPLASPAAMREPISSNHMAVRMVACEKKPNAARSCTLFSFRRQGWLFAALIRAEWQPVRPGTSSVDEPDMREALLRLAHDHGMYDRGSESYG